MARAVQIVESGLPQGLTRNGVELRASGTIGKAEHLQVDMPFQHQRVDAPLLVSQRTEGNGAGNVCRAVLILGAAVDEQQSPWLQGRIGRWRRLIVDNGAMGLIARNGVERQAAIQWLLTAQLFQFPADADLRLTTSLDSRFQPAQPFHQCNAVLQHRMAQALLLSIVLDGFHRWHGRWLTDDDVGPDLACQQLADLIGVNEYAPFAPLLQGFAGLFVWLDGDVQVGQVVPDGRRHFPLVDKQRCRATAYQQMADEYRAAMYVAAAQVQRPGYIVQTAHQHTVGMPGQQGLADARQFPLRRFACKFYGLKFKGVHGHGRTVSPDTLQDVKIGTKCQSTRLAKRLPQLRDGCYGVRIAVGTHLLAVAVGQLLAQPLGNGRRTLHLEFHQLVFGTLQLLLGSNKVTRVCPEGSALKGDDSRSGRTVEATNPLAALPTVGHIFTIMRVAGIEDVSPQMFAAQFLAHQFHSFTNFQTNHTYQNYLFAILNSPFSISPQRTQSASRCGTYRPRCPVRC